MATSGSRDFEPDVAEYVEEAFERCGLEYRTGYDGVTARRSLNLLFADWANRGLNQWTINNTNMPLCSRIRIRCQVCRIIPHNSKHSLIVYSIVVTRNKSCLY